jgi:HEAT repeat protein/uncharacterized Zn finger protein (UPF0148 family)
MATATACPTCGHRFSGTHKKAGDKLSCPNCGHRFSVDLPEADADPAAANPRLGILVSNQPKKEGKASSSLDADEKTDSIAPPRAELAGKKKAAEAGGSGLFGRAVPAREAAEENAPPPFYAAPPVAAPPVAAGPTAMPVVSTSGRRLTTLVLDAVKAVVGNPATPVKGVTELSLISLTLGLTGLAITWPFRLGSFGMVLAGVGFVLGGVAIGILLKRKTSEYVLPALATIINFQGFVMALVLACLPEPPTEAAPPAKQGEQFPALADLETALAASDPEARARAIRAVGALARGLETTRASLLIGLHDGNEQVRGAAAETLGNLGPLARVAYPVLADVAKNDTNADVRRQAQRALKKLSPPTRDDLSDFLAILKDRQPHLRSAAAQALGMIGPDAHDAVSSLVRLLGDGEVHVRVSAAQALADIDENHKGLVEILVAGLEDRAASAAVRRRAAATLGNLRTKNPKAIDALENALDDVDASVRLKAVFALGSIGELKSVPKFQAAMRDPEARVRIVAAHALWLWGKQTKGIPVLIDILKDRVAEVRANSALVLEKIARDAKDAEPAVAAAVKEAVVPLGLALSDEDGGVRARAAEALYHIGPNAADALSHLRQALKSADPSLRTLAAYALSGMRTEARPAATELRFAVDHEEEDSGVRLFAARALWACEEKLETLLPTIMRILRKEKDAGHRARAAATLGAMGAPASSAVAPLLEALEDKDTKVRAAAAAALGDIGGPLARATYTTLFELTKEDQPEEIRKAAAEALRKVGRPTKADVKSLELALTHDSAKLRASAAVSLWLMNRDAKAAVASLSKALDDSEATVRQTAVFALAAMGPDATAAVPALISAIHHKDEILRTRAVYTLGEIGKGADKAAAELNRILTDDKEKLALRVQAARSLWAIAQQTTDVLAILCAGLKDSDADLQIAAADTLAKMGPRLDAVKDFAMIKEQAVPALTKLIQEGEENAPRLPAIHALGSFGVHAQEAVPLLVQALEVEDVDLRTTVTESLGKIALGEAKANKKAMWTKAAYRGLVFFSKLDQNERVQRAASAALLSIGEPGGDDVDILLTLAQDAKLPPFFRSAAAQVLGLLGGTVVDKDIARVGRGLAVEKDAGLRAQLAYVLGEIGGKAKDEHLGLVDCLRDPDPGLRVAAAVALSQIFQAQPAPAAVRAALREAADSADENVKAAAEAALKRLAK